MQPDKSTPFSHGFQPIHAAGSRLRLNLQRRYRPTASIRRTRVQQELCTSTAKNRVASWTLLKWTQVTAGVGFAILDEAWGYLPHGVGQWLSSLRDSLADSECTIEIAKTYIVIPWQIHDRILMEDAITRDFTDGRSSW
jgi:hypothetical protein